MTSPRNLRAILLVGVGSMLAVSCTQPTAPGLDRYEAYGLYDAAFPLQFELTVPPQIGKGGLLTFVVTVRNGGDEPLTVTLAGEAFDVVVLREDGRVVWQRLRGLDLNSERLDGTLLPGQSTQWEISWRASVAPGSYSARAILLGNAQGHPGFVRSPAKSLIVTQ